MTESQALAKLKALMVMVRGQGDVSPEQFARMACASVGIDLPQRTPGAIRQKRWRDTHRRNDETPFDTLQRHSERNERNASVTPGETVRETSAPSALPLSPSGSESSPENSSSLSALSEGPVSKRARRTKRAKPPSWKFVPDDWRCKQKHVALAKQLGVSIDAEEAKFRNTEYKVPKTDADRAFTKWLHMAAEGRGTQQNASSRDGVPIVAHPLFKPDKPIPASEKLSAAEIADVESRMKSIGRQVGT